ncbi:MAG: TolC family protein [Deltaproteobacteria bacterium]|nr:TolC family protein [Deltaproteobacteria bacterium]
MTGRTTALLLAALAAPALGHAQAPARPVLSLEDATRLARENQPLLRQAQAGTRSAQARADQDRAALLPQVSAAGSYTIATDNPARPPLTATSGGWDTADSWLFSGKLSQLVWDFGRTREAWAASRARAEAQQDTERSTALQVLLAARTGFFTARAAKDLVTVARESLANQEAHLRQIQGFVEVGTRPEIDLAQARTDRANARVQLINAENGYEVAKAQLNQAMGVERSTDYDVADEALGPIPGEEQDTEALLGEALAARPDVAALQAQVRAQEASVRSAQGGYYPSLSVSTGLTQAGPRIDFGYWNWSATASLTWNLFQGGLTEAQAREARAGLDGLASQLAAARQQVRLEVEQARLAVRAAREAREAAGEALVNARERLRLAEGRYQTGAGSALEQGDAQLALTSAGAQKVQADYSLSSARALLLRALGRP